MLSIFSKPYSATLLKRGMMQLFGERSGILSDELKVLKKQAEIDILDRDKGDSERRVVPVKVAVDVLVIDNSAETLTQVGQTMYDAIFQKVPNLGA